MCATPRSRRSTLQPCTCGVQWGGGLGQRGRWAACLPACNEGHAAALAAGAGSHSLACRVAASLPCTEACGRLACPHLRCRPDSSYACSDECKIEGTRALLRAQLEAGSQARGWAGCQGSLCQEDLLPAAHAMQHAAACTAQGPAYLPVEQAPSSAASAVQQARGGGGVWQGTPRRRAQRPVRGCVRRGLESACSGAPRGRQPVLDAGRCGWAEHTWMRSQVWTAVHAEHRGCRHPGMRSSVSPHSAPAISSAACPPPAACHLQRPPSRITEGSPSTRMHSPTGSSRACPSHT